MLLTGLGHHVDIAYLPFRTWWEEVDDFDLRRHRLYLLRTLNPLRKVFGFHDISKNPNWSLSNALLKSVEEQSRIDTQYTLQREVLNLDDEGEDGNLYRLRQQRNSIAANAAMDLLAGDRYDVVIIPNGSILEFGIFYRVAHHLRVPTVTIEFGEQRERMWLAQNDEVMRLDTSGIWAAKGGFSLTEAELEQLKTLYEARRGGKLWANFARQWQSGESTGAAEARSQLGLDPEKPLALLCTNVVGDSLALGRQIFTAGMADWLAETVHHFAQRPEFQIVVRVHPGELLGAGHPSVDIVRSVVPEMPSHVVVIPPESKINTYDLIELAHIGLVYTTTVGMEMAMSGVPVVVGGRTHYRDKGFTYDPETLSEYITTVDQILCRPLGERIPQEKVQLAWNYAYRFFFEYPFPFPWHLITFWKDIEDRTLKSVLSDSIDQYASTIDALLGKPISWGKDHGRGGVGS
ncbi:MAG: hypothetical protein A2Z14_03985 [Chloroflexi bacterium RBG_16_48_8]|nr:MAG: hypothetical protein A2Z14_03985 [Chloroflexi bacterium RBG_16_48_8]